ncbi:MAG TPA: choice-of-anchor L domain-containing protein, partial [Flavobacteriales bacterium]
MMTSTLGFSANSLKRFAAYLSLTLSAIICTTTSYSQLTVNESAPDTTMQNLIQGNGVTITSFSVTKGKDSQVSSFSNNPVAGNPLTVTQGILLSTGDGRDAVGPNNNGGKTKEHHVTYYDPDLMALASQAIHDVVIVEFDVIPKTDTLQLTFQWGSDEYPEFTCSPYNDVFAFLVSGPGISGPFTNGAANFALLPDGTPVSIGTVNSGTPGASYSPSGCASLSNSAYYINNPTGNSYIQADGITSQLKVKGVVVPCETYHVKCVLADTYDEKYDSWVWLQGFEALGQMVTITPNITGQQLVEGCNTVEYKASRVGDLSVPVTVNLTYSGTATSGVDYLNAPDSIAFASGQSEVYFYISPVLDEINEGVETVIITATWDICSQTMSADYHFTISDPTVSITCPANVTVNAAPGTCEAVATFSPPVASEACGLCPAPESISGFTHIGTYNGHTYFRSNVPMTWTEARNAAIDKGAHLLTINSAGEQSWIASQLSEVIWLGLSDYLAEENYEWITGEPLSYTNWCGSNPENSEDNDFVFLNPGTGGCWDNTGNAFTTHYFVLEYSCNLT